MSISDTKPASITIRRNYPDRSIFSVRGTDSIIIRDGTSVSGGNLAAEFKQDTAVAVPELTAGTDYYIRLNAMNEPVATPATELPGDDVIGGFHFAPGGNAPARAGGDTTPAINPYSCWDAGFRPACPDPRGMALVERDGLRFWCDIYFLGVDHIAKGTSRFGEEIADGRALPAAIAGNGKFNACDFPTVQAIYAHHGKGLLTYDEFRAAAYGVTERSSADKDPKSTGIDAQRSSRFGIMQATGNMWAWGTDGDPDDPRPSLFGGSWILGGDSGSRCADLGPWPGVSAGSISARGRSDHLAS
ncbi:hypothetical protein [Mesorhizobium sp. SP-1A]|uniref:phage major tropism determinant n=1 Tax=Mesorhizobium sp. SP-1A TaxID=3077840 RepID=UPI0028F73ABF|nr:hypothetical protein [Mesorhizobium sp. SP-1A]